MSRTSFHDLRWDSDDPEELHERSAEVRAKAAEVIALARSIREANRRVIAEARRLRGVRRPKRD